MKKLSFVIIDIITGRTISAQTRVKIAGVNTKVLDDNPITESGNGSAVSTKLCNSF